MNTLRHYVTTSFLTTFLATVAVFTFVLSIGGLFKLTDLVTRGVALRPLLAFFINGVPSALSFAIPISAITASLLLFGRLSADSEITAMRACGISLWQVLRWFLPLAFLLLLVCTYINAELVPRGHYSRWLAIARLGAGSPLELIEEGRTIREFDGLLLYVERRKGEVLEHIRIFDEREPGRTREIKAERGVVAMPTNSNDIVLSLEQVTVDPFSFERPGAAYSGKWSVRIPDARRAATYRRRDKDLSLVELLMGIRALKQEASDAVNTPVPAPAKRLARMENPRVRRTEMLVLLNRRLVLSASSFVFLFFGIPMGIRSHRKESSISIGLCLLVVFLFYMMTTFAGQLSGRPGLRPDLLIWSPAVLLLLIDGFLIWRLR